MTGCLLAPFKILGFIFKAIWLGILWCCTNGIKGFVVGGFCILVIGFFLGSLHGAPATQQTTQGLQNQGPTKIEAPYLVETPTQNFYALEALKQGDDWILTPCWSFQNGKWVKFESMRLTKEGGQVTVRKR